MEEFVLQTLDPQQDRSRLIKALLEVSKLHTMQIEPDAMLDLILEHLGEVVPYNSASILLRQGESELRIVAGRGYAQSPAVLDTVFDTRNIRRFHSILNNRLPVRVADVRESPDWVEIAGTEQIRAWIGVPLNSRGRIIGVLSVDRNTPNAFGDDDLKIAYTFANEVAVVIEKALLTDAVEEQRSAIEHANRNEAIPAGPGRPRSRILKAVLEAAPQNLLPAFSVTSGAARPPSPPPIAPAAPPVPPPAPVPPATRAASTGVGAAPPRPAERVDDASVSPQLAALEAKVRRSRFPTPKMAPSPRPLGTGLDLAGLGLVPPETAAVPAAPTEVGATAVPAPPSSTDLKRETLLFGKILLSNKLIKQEALEECLRLQERIRVMGLEVRLGQLCVDRGIIDAKTLDAVLKLQKQKFLIDGDPLALRRKGLTADTDVPIGRLAIENGLITQVQLDEAIVIQQRVRTLGVEKRLGEILVERHSLTEDGLDGLLQVQRQRSQTLPVVPASEPARPTTKPTSKLGLDDAAFAALDNDLLVRLIRPSGLLTKTQLAECERLRAELEASSVQKRVDEIAVQRGFATREAIRKIVDMEFLKWRETAGKAPARPAPVAAGAQKRRGMGVEIAAVAVVVIGLTAGVWYQATRPSRDKEMRADEMARAKADLAAVAHHTTVGGGSPHGGVDPRPGSHVEVPDVPPPVPISPVSPEDVLDVAAELAQAPALFPEPSAALLELRGVTRETRGGGVDFLAYGRSTLVDGTEVSVSLRYGGLPIGTSEPAAVLKGGYFFGRVRVGSREVRAPGGYYTLDARVPVATYQRPGSGAGAFVRDEGGNGGGGWIMARATIQFGTDDEIRADHESLTSIYRSAGDGLEGEASELKGRVANIASNASDSMEDWDTWMAGWETRLSEILGPAQQVTSSVAAHPVPRVQALLNQSVQALRDWATAERSALARRRHISEAGELSTANSSHPPSIAERDFRSAADSLKAGVERYASDTPAAATIRDFADAVQGSADRALEEISDYVTLLDRQKAREVRIEWIEAWADRCRLLSSLDAPLRGHLAGTHSGLFGLLDEYVILTEACGRARLVEWLEGQKLAVPAGLKPRERRNAQRLADDRAALLVRLQKLLPAS